MRNNNVYIAKAQRRTQRKPMSMENDKSTRAAAKTPAFVPSSQDHPEGARHQIFLVLTNSLCDSKIRNNSYLRDKMLFLMCIRQSILPRHIPDYELVKL